MTAPEQPPVGFKEWALVCDDLAAGRHSLILRKGGIDEQAGGFRFEHPEFFLFPTLYHEQAGRLKLPPETPCPAADPSGVIIRHFARVEWFRVLTDLREALALDAFHLWKEEVVRERFGYGEAALHVAFVRLFTLPEPWVFPDAPEYGGCRSWTDLPASTRPPTGDLPPVLGDPENAARSRAILDTLEAARA